MTPLEPQKLHICAQIQTNLVTYGLEQNLFTI